MRDGKITPADIQGGTFSISSLGGIGGTNFTPIVNAPELAILGVVRSSMKPVWDGKAFEPRLMLPLCVSYDHRIIDGALAARFAAAWPISWPTCANSCSNRGGPTMAKTDIRIPDIGDFKNVPVIEILVKPGDEVAVETALLTLESDKATIDIPSPSAGKVAELKVTVGDKVSEGTVILTLELAAAAAGDAKPAAAAPAQPPPRPRRRRHPIPADRTSLARCWCSAPARRLFGGVPRGRPRPVDCPGRALARSRRRLPECRLHSVQGAAAHRSHHRRSQGDGRAWN